MPHWLQKLKLQSKPDTPLLRKQAPLQLQPDAPAVDAAPHTLSLPELLQLEEPAPANLLPDR